ncbi:pyridoxal phosphate-dependent aminotransferase [Oscillospiraceae bacterium MB08-C2-2]|nr:pyridoxal phosphate-dependent aminotransferase [Oscillospiraceae bacterium MB08-C2-2]
MEKIYKGSAAVNRMEPSPIRMMLDWAAALRAEGRWVIPFSAGEPDFNTPQPVKEATIRAINENYTHYCSNRGLPQLRQVLAEEITEQTTAVYDPETEILITTSGAEAINNALLAFIDPGDEVIVFTPAFVSYKNLIRFCGGVMVELPLKAENGFIPEPAELERLITPRTRMLVLNNPNNPTGAVYPLDCLEAIGELALRYDLLVVSDEMYAALVYDGAEFCSIGALEGMKERSIIISGFSKTYAMTGWRLGYIAADRRLCERILRMHQYTTTCSPTFIQKGLADSIRLPETKAAVSAMVERFAARRQLLLKGLQGIGGLRCGIPYGAFYVMVDVSETGLTGEEFAQRLLKECGVASVPAIGLGDHCGRYIRISYAASEEDIREGLSRMENFVKGLVQI